MGPWAVMLVADGGSASFPQPKCKDQSSSNDVSHSHIIVQNFRFWLLICPLPSWPFSLVYSWCDRGMIIWLVKRKEKIWKTNCLRLCQLYSVKRMKSLSPSRTSTMSPNKEVNLLLSVKSCPVLHVSDQIPPLAASKSWRCNSDHILYIFMS